jgi:hypothetical protein
MIQPGDWIDLEGGLTVNAYAFHSYTPDGGVSLGPNSAPRLIVVGINSFRGKNGNEPDRLDTGHVVFQFQNAPVTRRMHPYVYYTGYYDSEMRNYLSGNFLNGLVTAGVPQNVMWAPVRKIAKVHGINGENGENTVQDLLWLPTEREMFGSNTYSSGTYETEGNQARLEYYTTDQSRKKNGVYWLASPRGGNNTGYDNCAVNANGGPSQYALTQSYGVAPAFCVKYIE